ncbi:MAG: hypothetical protein H6680_00450 [Desulfobacteraceae bacterium]|nr:hypothetical protein [Desulfobacteraceae bacterium]
MTSVIFQIFPVIMTFFTGMILRQFKVVSSKDSDFILRLIFYAGIPCLIIKSFYNSKIEKEFIFLPFTAVFVLCFSGLIVLLLSYLMKPQAKTKGAAITGAMIMNTGFCLPFIETFYGSSALMAVLIFDIGNAFFVFTGTFIIAGKFSGQKKLNPLHFLNFLKNPPLLSILLISIINFFHIEIYPQLMSYFEFISQMVLPLIMIAIGVKFNFTGKISKFLFLTILSRMAGGFAAAFFVLLFFKTDPLIKAGILICSAAPIGYNTITFAVLKDLDNEFAASAVSLSAFSGLLVYPLVHFYIIG